MKITFLQLTLILLGFLILTVTFLYYYIVSKIRRLEIQSYTKKCRESYFELPLNDSSEEISPSVFLLLSLNVELSNCPNLGEFPIPYGYKGKKFFGKILGKKRMIATVLTFAVNTIIIFTGTVFTDEWSEDFDITQVLCNNLGGYRDGDKTHRGFYDVYMSIRSEIFSYISHINSKTLYVTGHSMGGALSTLFAYDMYYLNPIVYTFASPRVFNISGAKTYDQILKNTNRIFNTEDIFTSLPLPVFGSEIYQHVGGGISFTINLASMAENHTDAYVLHFGKLI